MEEQVNAAALCASMPTGGLRIMGKQDLSGKTLLLAIGELNAQLVRKALKVALDQERHRGRGGEPALHLFP